MIECLFSDAEATEDSVEQIVGVDCTDDFAEGVKGNAGFRGDKGFVSGGIQ